MNNYQAQLLKAIWDGSDEAFNERGLTIYRQNLVMNAERSLSISYPTVVQLVSEEFFSLLVREFIHFEKLSEGDWGMWGKTFPDWLANNESLLEYPFISDCAKLDWLCHLAERAPSEQRKSETEINNDSDLSLLSIHYCAGAKLLKSKYPIVDIYHAHQTDNAPKRQYLLTDAKQKLSQGIGQNALIWRPHWQALVREVNKDESTWLTKTFEGSTMSAALDRASPTFNFENWLHQSISDGLVTGFY